MLIYDRPNTGESEVCFEGDNESAMQADTLAALGEICRDHSLWLISDEVYGSLLFGGRKHASVLAVDGAEERIECVDAIKRMLAGTLLRAPR